MDIIIASQEPSIVVQLRNCLARLGVECSRVETVSHEMVSAAVAKSPANGPLLVFFASSNLTPRELEKIEQSCSSGRETVKVVVVTLSVNAQLILQAVRNGAMDVISLSNNLEVELRHLLDRVRSAGCHKSHLGRLWTVISASGGTGASLLATSLAAEIAQREERSCLLDLHWRGGDLATLLNCHPRYTLLSLACKSEQLDRTMFEHSLVRHDCGIHLLASPEPFSDYRQIHGELIQRIVQLARSAFKTVIVDLEDCEHLDQVRTLAASDRIIVPLRPDFVSLVRTKKLLRHLMSSGVKREHISVVANRIGRPRELSLHQIEKALETRACIHIPDDPVSTNEAVNLGMPLVVACRHSRAAAGIVHLAESLLDVHKPPSRWKSARELFVPVKTVTRLMGVSW